nr:major outer-capsid protein [Pteropine orthoreovirus]
MEVRTPNFHSFVESAYSSYLTRPDTWNPSTLWETGQFVTPDVIRLGNAYCCAQCCGVLYYGYRPINLYPFPHHRCHQLHRRETSPLLKVVRVGRTTDMVREHYAVWLQSLVDHLSDEKNIQDKEPMSSRVASEVLRNDVAISGDFWRGTLDLSPHDSAQSIHESLDKLSEVAGTHGLLPDCLLNVATHDHTALKMTAPVLNIYDQLDNARRSVLSATVTQMPKETADAHKLQGHVTKEVAAAALLKPEHVIVTPIMAGLPVLARSHQPSLRVGMPLVDSTQKASLYRSLPHQLAHGYHSDTFRTMFGLSANEAESRLIGHHRTMLCTLPAIETSSTAVARATTSPLSIVSSDRVTMHECSG